MKNSFLHVLNLLVFFSVVINKTKSDFTCSSAGKFPHLEDPTKYHECHFVGENKYTMFLQYCPQDNCFDAASTTCGVDYCERQQEVTLPMTFNCQTTGKFPHLDSSRKDAFYKCIEIKGKLFAYEYHCLPAKPCFSYRKQMCERC